MSTGKRMRESDQEGQAGGARDADETLRPLLDAYPKEGVNIISFRGNFFLRAGIDGLAKVGRYASFFARQGTLF